MSTKLTLTVEKQMIDLAKKYAKNTDRSLSEIVENYFKTLTLDVENKKISSSIAELVGVVKLPDNFDEKQELLEYLENKHL